MSNETWLREEQKFLTAIEDVNIPNATLNDVDNILLKKFNDTENIPDGSGCYWIWTNEPVLHTLHKHPIPMRFNDGEVIYNGIAKDDVRGRIKHHLFGQEDAGWSGISLDIYFDKTESHRKKAFSKKGKVTYIYDNKSDYILYPLACLGEPFRESMKTVGFHDERLKITNDTPLFAAG